MNTILFPHMQDPGNRHNSENRILKRLYPYHQEVNITEGGEFLDDAIRTKDQPLANANPVEMNNPL